MKFSGRYKLIKEFGSSANNIVCLCLDTEENKTVVIKIGSKKGMVNEMSILSFLNNNSIIKYYGEVTIDGLVGIILEYVEGTDLYYYMMGKNSDIRSLECKKNFYKDLFYKILLAVYYCHNNGIAHRDLKPENILITENSDVKLIDFELGLKINRDVLSKVWIGTVLYSAPEMIQHKGYYGPEIDIWALGIIMFELFCGYHPFIRYDKGPESPINSENSIIKRIINKDYIVPQNLDTHLKYLINHTLVEKEKRIELSELLIYYIDHIL